MARSRKTIEVQTLKATMNQQIARTDISIEARKALCYMLEHILMDTNNYHGFSDIYWMKEGGYDAWVADGSIDGPAAFPNKYRYIWGPEGLNEDGTYTDPHRRQYY